MYSELEEALREGKIPRIREAVKSARTPALEEFRAGLISGRELTGRLSDLTDDQIRIFADHYLRAFKDQIAIVCTGGNGRQDIHPYSDLDLLVLVPKELPEGFEDHYSKFYLALLDAGFTKPGVAVRTAEECIAMAKEDHTIWTSLLDRRNLWGASPLYKEMDKAVVTLNTGYKQKFLADKIAERRERLQKMGDSRYMLHPNVKEGKGGLRDYQTFKWIAGIAFGKSEIKELLAPAERVRIEAAYSFLTTVRSHLHDMLGQPFEQITAEIMPALVDRYNKSRPEAAPETIESFMKQYFGHTREIGFFANVIGAAIEERNRWTKRRWHSEADFQTSDSHVRFKPGARLSPASLVSIFYLASERGLTLHHTALRTIRAKANSVDDSARNDPALNSQFMRILSLKGDTSRLLRQMLETGLLQNFIPAFDHIDRLMQFDPYHEYTVDEHTFACLHKMHEIEAGSLAEEAPLATQLFATMNESERRILYAAILLHDVCKGRGGKHEVLGADYALEICPRLGLSDKESQAVSWLIRNHLLLSHTAFHRDTDDQVTVSNFCKTLPSEKHLDMLAILTTSDIMGVGPGRWNWNKAASVEHLYNNAKLFMCEKELQTSHESFIPPGYREGDTAIQIHNNKARKVTVVSVVTPDKPELFGKLTGAISLIGGNIIDARIQTMGSTAIDSFILRNPAGAPYDETDFDRLRQRILSSLGRDSEAIDKDVAALGRKPKKYNAYKVEPVISFNNAASRSDTVLEIEARDRPELLYELSKIFNREGLDLQRAKVTVYGHKAIDTFYVRDRETGGKIAAERFKPIRDALIASPVFSAG